MYFAQPFLFLAGDCLRRTSCSQLVSGRNLRYGRALAIIQDEEYLNVVRSITTILTVKYAIL